MAPRVRGGTAAWAACKLRAMRFVPTPELRAAALPPIEGRLVLPSPKLLVAGRARTPLPALHDTLVATLEARARFAEKSPSPTLTDLQLLLATERSKVGPFASALADAYGLVAIVRALVSPVQALLVTERTATPKAEWILGADAAIGPDVRVLPVLAPEWLDALRRPIHDAPAAVREELVAIVSAARKTLPIATRASIARAFAEPSWAEEDATEVLGIANRNLTSGRGLSPVRMLLPYVTSAATFERLVEASISVHLYASGVHAEVALFAEPAVAEARLVTLLAAPLENESTAYVIEVTKVLACFEGAAAADAIASAAHVARDVASAYFTAYPALVPHLETWAKGRGRKVEVVRSILEVLRRASAATTSTEAPTNDLPRCIASPPWDTRAEPWPARELALVLGGRERIVETKALLQAKTEIERWAPRRRPASDALDAEILAKKGKIQPERYLELGDDAALASTDRLAADALVYALARFGERAIEVVSGIVLEAPMRTHAIVIAALRSPRLAEVAFRTHRDADWLLDDPECAALGLVPALFSSDPERRWDAERALLLLATKGRKSAIFSAARAYGEEIEEATRRILARDPWQRLPPTLPPLRPVFESGTLPPLRTADGLLPASATPIVGMLLTVSDPWRPHPGLAELRTKLTVESRDTFAWEVYERTAVVAHVGHLGADFCARRLDAKLLSKQALFSVAERFALFAALDRIGTPLARMLLLGHAITSRYQDRTEYVLSLLAARAEAPGELREEDDFPTVESPLVLDFGPRKVEAHVDDQLSVRLVDEAGARLPKMPRPTKKDDPDAVALALARHEALVTDLSRLRATAIVWLERAMAEERTWSLARFREGILGHTALRRLARGIVWQAAWAGSVAHVRVAEDATFADARDTAVVLPEDARVAVAHPALVDAAERDAFVQAFVDYEILPPFEQLDRKVFCWGEGEAEASTLVRFSGVVVAAARREKLYGARGWQEGARPATMVKKVRCGSVVMHLEAQSVHRPGEAAADRIGTVTLFGPNGALPFGSLTAVETSEINRDLEDIRLV